MPEFFAYLDAGTGSIIFQSLIGVIAGIAVFGRRAFSSIGHKARTILARFSRADSTADNKS